MLSEGGRDAAPKASSPELPPKGPNDFYLLGNEGKNHYQAEP